MDVNNGSESFSRLKQIDTVFDGYYFSIKQENGTNLQWYKGGKYQPISIKDCVFEPKSLGGRLVYAVTFVSTIRTRLKSGTFDVYWVSPAV